MLVGPVIDTIGFDGDDTLWHSETEFELTQTMFVELLAPFVPSGEVNLAAQLAATELGNLAVFGYGVKSFTLSMIETALDVSHGTVPADVTEGAHAAAASVGAATKPSGSSITVFVSEPTRSTSTRTVSPTFSRSSERWAACWQQS